MEQEIKPNKPFFTVLIPAHNESGCIESTCLSILKEFEKEKIEDYEILVVNDHSVDNTEQILQKMCSKHSCIRYVNNDYNRGFGFAVRKGLDEYRGEAVAIVMGDMSDSPADIVAYYRALKNGAECVFGSRFIKGGKVVDYPKAKLIINRLANHFIKLLFRIPHNDITNAFKAYKREVINGISPLLSQHFNLTVEMPLKAIVRGFKYVIIPITWHNRKTGFSKWQIKEMGSRYMFIVLYVWLEKLLSRGDYLRKDK